MGEHFIHVEIGNDACRAQFAVGSHRIAQEHVPRAADKEGRGETLEIAIHRRYQLIAQFG